MANTEKTAHGGQDQLAAFMALIGAVGASLDIEAAYAAFAQHSKQMFDWSWASVGLLDESGRRIVRRALGGRPGMQTEDGGAYLTEHSAAGWVIDHREPLICSIGTGKTHFAYDEVLLTEHISQYVEVPISVHGRVIGTLTLASARSSAYRERDLPMLVALANTLGIAIENVRLYEQMRAANEHLAVAAIEQQFAAEESERRAKELDTVIGSIADAVFVCDAAGNITLSNDVGLALIGKQQGEHLGTLTDCLNRLRVSFANGRPVPLEKLAITRAMSGEIVRGQREVGTDLRTNRRVDLVVSAAPLRDEAGRIVGAVEVASNVNQLKELTSVAQQRAAELHGILDNMVDGVFACDAAHQMTLANDAGIRLLGLADAAEIRRPLSAYPAMLCLRRLDGKSKEMVEMPLARALQGQTIDQEDEIIWDARRQQDVFVRTSASPIRDEEGRIVGAVAVARDVTKLGEIDRMKEDFIAVAAHELKTPVAIMKGYAQALLRSADDLSPPARRMLEAINRGTGRIDRIVQDLLDISRLNLGRLELLVERIDLPELVAEVADRAALTVIKHRIRVVSAEAVIVWGDRDRLEQVLVNLINNAIKYSPNGGEVDLSIAVRGNQAVVAVKDYGVGIPKAKQADIFQRFYRAHAGTAHDYAGMGVGLYISKEILTRHGGQIWFESEEGKWSVFYFSLPLRSPLQPDSAQQTSGKPARTVTGATG